MTDKEAIERLKRIDIRFFLSGMNEQSNYIVDEADKTKKAIEKVVNLIQTQQAEIKYWKEQAEGYSGLAKQIQEDYMLNRGIL